MYIHRNNIVFEWDEQKDQQNFWKHGVWFEEAKTIWNDPLHSEYYDVEHSDQEDRFVRSGYSDENKFLIVAYHEKNAGNVIRIISARMGTGRERELHEKGI